METPTPRRRTSKLTTDNLPIPIYDFQDYEHVCVCVRDSSDGDSYLKSCWDLTFGALLHMTQCVIIYTCMMRFYWRMLIMKIISQI